MSMRPKRSKRGGPVEDFEDPLQNYDTPEIEDELERSIAEDNVSQLQSTPFWSTGPQTTVQETLAQMDQANIGCVLIVDADQRLLGIFSDRDVLMKAALDYDRVKDLPISELMTPKPVVVYVTDPAAQALGLMAVGGFRHVPVLDVDDRVVGVIGPQRVVRFLEKHLPLSWGETPSSDSSADYSSRR